MRTAVFLILVAGSLAGLPAAEPGQPVPLSDGKSFAGWEGDAGKTWRVEAGAFVGGSLRVEVPRNEFLATRRAYTNFVLRLEFKLVGSEGFVNAGVQFRSERVQDPPNEMRGYQADIGEGWYGALYDESRRNKVLVAPKPDDVRRALKPSDWNEYVIRAEGRHIRMWINGVLMVDYTEPDTAIPQQGLIGLQIHGGGKAEVSYRGLTIEELP